MQVLNFSKGLKVLIKCYYYSSSHSCLLIENFTPILVDGWLLPSFSERLIELSSPSCTKDEAAWWQKELHREKMCWRGIRCQKMGGLTESENVRWRWGGQHRPQFTSHPCPSAQRESALRKRWKAGGSVEHTKADEQHCWAVNIQFNAPVILRFPWLENKFHRIES